MQQYWINHKGVQSGPMTIDELRQLTLDDTAYVWCNGMDDWKKITEVPELLQQLAAEPAAQPVAQAPEVTQPPVETPQVPEAPVAAAPAAPPVGVPVGTPVGTPVGEPVYAPQGYAPAPAPAPAAQPYAPQGYAAQPQPAAAVQDPAAKCPPTNLGWAIAATVLCCLPLGVVAIIMSTRVSRYWNMGDVERAQKWSDRTAWVIIASIILGIVVQPFVSAVQMLTMSMP